jgi:ribosomal protein L37AE/L43A
MTDFERERIMKMKEIRYLHRCPKCKKKVFPRMWGEPADSGMRWCPECLKGEAGMFWREL